MNEKIEKLIHCAALLIDQQDAFKVGDVVTWKCEEFVNQDRPDFGGVVVVTRVYKPLVTSNSGHHPSSVYFCELIDFAGVTYGYHGDIQEHHYDSRRFRLALPEEISAAYKVDV